MAEPNRLALVGATGLVGRTIMEQLVGLDSFRLTAIARREVPLPKGARMQMRLSHAEHWEDIIAEIQPEIVICALGTTWRKAGRKEDAFREVDEALVMTVARAAKEAGARQFIFVSSVGANAQSKNVYLRVKGEVEAALAKLRFKRLDILRPGLLRGHRQGDMRPAEGLGRLASPFTDLLLHGGSRRYRSITAHKLTEAILGLASEKAGGRFVHEHDALLRAAKRFEEPLLTGGVPA